MSALAGKGVLVVGLGRSGRAAARLAVLHGAAEVIGTDLRETVDPIPGVVLELGGHRRERFLGSDLVVVSPGIPAAQPDVAAAIAAGVETVGELGFAARFVTVPIVAITGTNGKSTVTSLTGTLLEEAGRAPFVGGNLGRPLAELPLAEAEGERFEVAVVEVSSYQLELPGAFRPRIGVILNLTPDHLARHGTLAEYAATKARVFARMGPGDLAILPADDEVLARFAHPDPQVRAWIGREPGVRLRANVALVRLRGRGADIELSRLQLVGTHNRWNAAVACLLAIAAGAPPIAVQEAIGALRPLAHRMEVVSEEGGVRWIDDSKATNVEAARVGIEGVERSSVVLLGGQAKGAGFAALAPALERHRAVITFGGSGPAIADELEQAGIDVHRCDDLAAAVAVARGLVRPGDAVLLSPGCASFDAFDDYEHRGRVFRALANPGAPR